MQDRTERLKVTWADAWFLTRMVGAPIFMMLFAGVALALIGWFW